MGLLDGLFGKPPKATDPSKVLSEQWAQTQKAGDTTLTKNSMDRSGPFGSSSFERDANGLPTGITSDFSPEMQGGVDSVTGAFGAQAGLLPTGAFNPAIDSSGIRQSYVDKGLNYALPAWAQEDNLRKTTMAERGIPLGSEIDATTAGQVADNRSRYLSDLSAGAWQAGANEEQRQFGNELTKYQLPQQMAAGNLGLLTGANALLPQAQQPQANYAAPDAQGAYASYDKANADAYATKQAGLGNLLKTGAALALAPVTGGLSGTLLGSGLDWMKGSPGTKGGMPASSR